MNKVFLVGNLTRDPELTQSQNGISICKFGIAVNRRFSSEKNEVDFFNVITWRTQAESCAKFLSKGRKVCVVGSVQIRTYEKDGEKRSVTEIVADDVEFLTPKDGGGSFEDGGSRQQRPKDISELEPVEADGDLPF